MHIAWREKLDEIYDKLMAERKGNSEERKARKAKEEAENAFAGRRMSGGKGGLSAE